MVTKTPISRLVASPMMLVPNTKRVSIDMTGTAPDSFMIYEEGSSFSQGCSDRKLHPPLMRKSSLLVVNAIERFAREMISQCALQMNIPVVKGSPLPTPSEAKRRLPSSIRKRIRFPDRRGSCWRAICEYLEPIAESVPRRTADQDSRVSNDDLIDLGWGIYLLVLAARSGSDVMAAPKALLMNISRMSSIAQLSAEARARLAVLEGLLRVYEHPTEIPGFAVTSNCSVVERLEEIVEDAYMLEASLLRRFFCMGANLASIRRDLRSITKFIAKRRPWAKGILKASAYTGALAVSNELSGFVNLIQENDSSNRAPACVDSMMLYERVGRFAAIKRTLQESKDGSDPFPDLTLFDPWQDTQELWQNVHEFYRVGKEGWGAKIGVETDKVSARIYSEKPTC